MLARATHAPGMAQRRVALSPGTPLPDLERRLLENYPWLAVVMVVVLTIPQAKSPGQYAVSYVDDPRTWDWLWITGVSAFLVLYPVSLRLPIQAARVFGYLEEQGILGPAVALRAFELSLHATANRWAGTAGRLVGATMFALWLAFFASIREPWVYLLSINIPGMLLEIPAAVATGRFLGRLACYGTLGRRLRTAGLDFRPVPGHADGSSGLEPLRALYVTPAMLIAAMAAFVGAWLLLIPSFPAYAQWQPIYLALLPLLLIFEAIAFLWPIHLLNTTLAERREVRHIDAIPMLAFNARTGIGLVLLNVLLAAPIVVALTKLHA